MTNPMPGFVSQRRNVAGQAVDQCARSRDDELKFLHRGKYKWKYTNTNTVIVKTSNLTDRP